MSGRVIRFKYEHTVIRFKDIKPKTPRQSRFRVSYLSDKNLLGRNGGSHD